VSPFGVRFSDDPNAHRYYIVVECDPADRIFIRVDTLVNERTQVYTVLKMIRRQNRSLEPSVRDLALGSGWAVQIRTYVLVFYMFLRYKLGKMGVWRVDGSKCKQYYI
jgi:hypothetical protein